MVWESNGTQCDFRLDVDLIPNGSYELSCEIIARMNSGTVAGQVGIEHYVEKRSWPLKVNARTETELPLLHRVNEEGLIEISWEVDEAFRDGFDHYRIEFTTLKKGLIISILREGRILIFIHMPINDMPVRKEHTRSISISKRKPTVPVRLDRLTWSRPNRRFR